MSRTSRQREILALIPVGVILAAAAWARVANYPLVLGNGELIPQLDGDSFYHLQRSLDTLKQFPRVPHFDPRMNWPKGAFCPWSDGFDLGAAAFAAALGGRGHLDRARIAIALWPVLLGVLSVWAAMMLVRVVAPGARWRGAALVAGLGVALMPEAVHHSRMGRIDHHVFEALVVTLLTAWSLQRLPVGRGRTACPRGLLFEFQGTFLTALAVYGFSGAPIYVAMAAGVLGFAAFRDGRLVGSGSLGLFGGAVLSAALTLPALLDHRRLLSFQLPSLLQPLLLACAAAGVAAGAGWGKARLSAHGGRWRRVLVPALLAVPAAALLAPPVRHEVQAALSGWVLRQDAWLSTVGEFSPLWRGARTGWILPYGMLGWAGFFLPVALLVLTFRLAPRSPRVAGLLFMTASVSALALVQTRFSRPMIPLLAVCIGLVATWVAREGVVMVARRCKRRRECAWWWRPAVIAPLAVALLDLVDLPTRSVFYPVPSVRLPPFIEAAIDLRDAPAPLGVEPGVLANWTYGHQVEVLAGVPVVVNGFGTYLDAPAFWEAAGIFRKGEAELDTYLAEHRIGVLFAGTGTIGNEVTGINDEQTFQRGLLNQQYLQQIPLSPLLIAGSAAPVFGVRHLAHLLPRFASHNVVAGLVFPLPYLWAYERVRGATVRGTAPAESRVLAELPFTENHRPHTYRAWTDVSPNGTWELILPFPSGWARPTIVSAPFWTASVKLGNPVRFEVPEQAVRTGRTIEIGALPAPVASEPRSARPAVEQRSVLQ